MGDSGKLRFYKLDHVSKMRLLKSHSHTSNGLAMELGARDKKKTLIRTGIKSSEFVKKNYVYLGHGFCSSQNNGADYSILV